MGAVGSPEAGSPAVETNAPFDGSDGYFSLDSPRSMEACRRRGLEDGDLEERPEESFFRHEQSQQRRSRPSKSPSLVAKRGRNIKSCGKVDTTAVIRKERHEINRHRLLREVIFLFTDLGLTHTIRTSFLAVRGRTMPFLRMSAYNLKHSDKYAGLFLVSSHLHASLGMPRGMSCLCTNGIDSRTVCMINKAGDGVPLSPVLKCQVGLAKPANSCFDCDYAVE